MGLFDNVFPAESDTERRQLPSHLVNAAFGEVNVRRTEGKWEVDFTILMEPRDEGWQTGVALDASSSMKQWYGQAVDPNSLSAEALAELRKAGYLESMVTDGSRVTKFRKGAMEFIKEHGIPLKKTKNVVEPIAQEFISYLAGKLDEDGGTTVVYWACGADGSQYEVVGDFTAEQCRTLKLTGPCKAHFGNGTRLTPVARYFVDRFADARNGMYVFMTDGRLDDMNDVINYTTSLARDIEAKRRNPVKFVLIGLGDRIDIEQMQQLDDLDTGTSVDIWDHKIAREMRTILDIFAELVDDNQIVAQQATIYDDQGNVVKEFSDGMTAKVKFRMPATSRFFELEVGGERMRQSVVVDDRGSAAK
jgi:hypothetical protein